MGEKRISYFTLLQVLLRSFFLQSSWNFEGMQNLGFTYSIGPAIKKLFTNREERLYGFKRHIGYFNTHPYMAPSILGVVIRMEDEIKRKKGDPEEVNSIKASLMGSFGAIGDSFFWVSIKPLSAVLGVIFAWLHYIWAPFLFLAFFNSMHLGFRVYGYLNGYRLGVDVVEKIKSFKFPDQTVKIKHFSAFCLGILLATVVFYSGFNFGIKNNTISLFVFPSIVFLLSFAIRRGIPQGRLLYILLFSLMLIYLAREAGA